MASIVVRYFASVRQLVGRPEQRVDLRDGETAIDLWNRLTGAPMPANTLVAINQEYQRPDTPVRSGDEVAVFPPVTGG